MSRLTSRPTTIRVQSKTSLAFEAADTPANTFRPFAGSGLSTRAAHSNSGILCDVTEDGQSSNHTIVDWCGKGVYDPIRKTVQWMGNGTGNVAGGWVYNVLAIYDEAIEGWSATRGFKLDGQSDGTFGIGHTYDNNCIDIAGRRHYKKQFNEAGGGSGKFYAYNLDTRQFEAGFSGPAGDPGSNSYGPADFIPTRRTRGAIWYAHATISSGRTMISEYDVERGGWDFVLPQGTFPALASYMGGGGVMSYNPRAVGGAGGTLIGGGSTTAYIVDAQTLAATAVSGAPVPVGFGAGGGHLCRDPTGPGWLLFVNATASVYRCDATGWTLRSPLPSQLIGYSFIVTPIDDYGVVWIVSERRTSASTPRAWLYRP